MNYLKGLPLDFCRGEAALAIFFINEHPDSEQITNEVLEFVVHTDPRELTRKECNKVLEIAFKYGWREYRLKQMKQPA